MHSTYLCEIYEYFIKSDLNHYYIRFIYSSSIVFIFDVCVDVQVVMSDESKQTKRREPEPDFEARMVKMSVLVSVLEGLVKIFSSQSAITNAICIKFTSSGISIFAQTRVSPIVGLAHIGQSFFEHISCSSAHQSWIPVYRVQSTLTSLKAMLKAGVASIAIVSNDNTFICITGSSRTKKFKLHLENINITEALLELDTVYNWQVSVDSVSLFQALTFLSVDKGVNEINEVRLNIGETITLQGFDSCGFLRDECELTEFSNNYNDTYSGRFQRKLLNIIANSKQMAAMVNVYFNLNSDDPLRFTWNLESASDSSHMTYYLMSMSEDD